MIIIPNVNKFNAPSGAGMAQWSKHKPLPTWVRFRFLPPGSDSDSDSIRGLSLSWFSPSSEGFSPGCSVNPIENLKDDVTSSLNIAICLFKNVASLISEVRNRRRI